MTSASEQALATYRELLAKVDAKFRDVSRAHAASMQCRLGCHSCCKPGLTVSPLEAESLKRHFAEHPEARRRKERIRRDDPHAGTRCGLLDADGSCIAYEARPIVCRSHGVPLKIREEASERLDACPLNFTGLDLTTLPPADCINLETLNTLLALLNRQFSGNDETNRSPIDRDA